MTVKLYRARNSVHKFMAVFPNRESVRFGLKGFSDYTIHKDKKRMERYLGRHRKRENWGKGGAQTAVLGLGGFCGQGHPFRQHSARRRKYLVRK
jgi:hypothetical protein